MDNLDMGQMIIKPSPPYNIRLHFDNYGFDEPQPHFYKDGRWWRSLRCGDNRLVPVTVSMKGSADSPKLEIEISEELSSKEINVITDKVRRIFNTDYELEPLYEFMEKDPTLKEIKENHYGLIPASTPSVYEAVIKSIIQQQISLKVAKHMTALTIKKFGEPVKAEGRDFWDFPTPRSLAEADVQQLRECKLSERKGEYIKDFSRAVASNDINPESLRGRLHEEIIDRLTEFRGIGRWTAEMAIVTSISLDDINPAGDLGARKAVSQFFNDGNMMSEEEVRELTGRWGKYKGMITYYCIAEVSH